MIWVGVGWWGGDWGGSVVGVGRCGVGGGCGWGEWVGIGENVWGVGWGFFLVFGEGG